MDWGTCDLLAQDNTILQNVLISLGAIQLQTGDRFDPIQSLVFLILVTLAIKLKKAPKVGVNHVDKDDI